MADGLVVRTNLPDFKRQLAELGQRFERNVVTRALRAAGGVFRDDARRRAPVLKAPDARRVAGALRRAIFVGRSRFRERGVVKFYVSVRATAGQRKRGVDPFYWRFLEGGWVARGAGRRIRGGKRYQALQRSRALKGGAQKSEQPFLAPAFQASQGRALDAFSKTMADGIAEENQKRL